MTDNSLVRPFRAILIVVAGVFLTVIFQDPISNFMASLGVDPKKFGIWQVGMLTGLLGFAIGVVTTQNLQTFEVIKNLVQNRRLKLLHTFEEDFALPFLGWTPDNNGEDIRPLIAHSASTLSEGFTSITDAAIFQLGPDARILMATSVHPADGKSTLCAGIARTLAARGSRVLVVDGDLRRPRQSDYFAFNGSRGVTDCIAANALPTDYIVSTEVEGVWVLPAGYARLKPDYVWHHFAERDHWSKLKSAYDFVIVDAPPVLSLADAPTLARAIKNVVFVVRHGAVEKSRTDLALRRLNLAGDNLKIVMAGMFLPERDYGFVYGYGYELSWDKPVGSAGPAS